MENQKSGVMDALGDYVRSVFDLNKDGRVSVKELISTLVPNYAVGIAFIVVDLLVLVAEYRVWDVGLKITNDPLKAIGFVLVSAVPFYLAQVLWLYPRAHWGQQLIAIGMAASSLYTSARFGLADLSLQYDVQALVNIVIRLTAAYIVALLVYIVTDRSIRLLRMKVQARDRANYQQEFNRSVRQILNDLRLSLADEQALRREFGDAAVDAHLQMMRKAKVPIENRQLPTTSDNKTLPAGAGDVEKDVREAFAHTGDKANPTPPPSR